MSARGFILIETMVAYVILAFALVSLVPAFVLCLRAEKKAAQTQAAIHLSTELLEEVRMRKWDETTSLPVQYTSFASATLGTDGTESATDKKTFDDVDDFNGWKEVGARDPLNRAINGLSSYKRTVTVRYVDSNLAVTASTSDFKQVEVCTSAPAIDPVCLDTILANR